MNNTNSNNINMIKSSAIQENILKANWLQQANVTNDFELSHQYANICQQHKQEKKWVLFINPEENSIEKLAKTHGIDISKILMVNYKCTTTSRSKIELAQVKSVLSKGNCSAVILSNSQFKKNEIAQLETSAKTGKTHCFLMKQCQLH
jgi:cell division inhibitor SulA